MYAVLRGYDNSSKVRFLKAKDIIGALRKQTQITGFFLEISNVSMNSKHIVMISECIQKINTQPVIIMCAHEGTCTWPENLDTSHLLQELF